MDDGDEDLYDGDEDLFDNDAFLPDEHTRFHPQNYVAIAPGKTACPR